MRIYELALILKPSLTGVKRKKIVDLMKSDLKGAKVTEEKEVGERDLTYKIKRETKGYYMDFVFEMENIPMDFEKKLINNEDVLRHLLIRRK